MVKLSRLLLLLNTPVAERWNRLSVLKNGVSSTSESHSSSVPVPGLPPGTKASPDGSGLGFDHFVVSMICTTCGVIDSGATNAAAVMLSALWTPEAAGCE